MWEIKPLPVKHLPPWANVLSYLPLGTPPYLSDLFLRTSHPSSFRRCWKSSVFSFLPYPSMPTSRGLPQDRGLSFISHCVHARAVVPLNLQFRTANMLVPHVPSWKCARRTITLLSICVVLLKMQLASKKFYVNLGIGFTKPYKAL